ncbi:single-stranded DNA-binding protein [Promicromonospora iranensis]|uniref:Single-strand DNA-binding protein n=1 Tax=Promicromonospora iranensis TaxID=1105144 RepID=A0ABU2CKM9_9MICO|nr:single-stranded DNA-binding protein [Promicromonospora iranensis]MDR7381892.1 single-strand DNA-binding protein [Promicromonospora iranensis]
MNDVTVTVSGNAGSTPALHLNAAKNLEWTTFRVASTRRYVNENGDWTDGATLWFTVKAWRTAALNVVESVHKGVPVVVTGRLEMDEWTGADGQQRAGLVIVATAIGVDATRGKVGFTRVVHHDTVPDGAPVTPVDGGGLTATRPGDVDPFGLDVLAPTDGDELLGDEGNEGDGSGVGQRELVNA